MSFGKLGALGRGFGHLGSGGQAGAPRNTLRARAGSFILSGTDMTPKSAYVVPAALGTFALTGIDATLTGPAGASITIDGNTFLNDGTASTTIAAPAITTANANTLLVVFMWGTAAASSVSDTSGLTWTHRGASNRFSADFSDVFWAIAPTARTTTITATYTGSATSRAINAVGFSGVNSSVPYDTNGSLPGIVGTGGGGGAEIVLSTTNAQTLIYAFYISTSSPVGGGAGWTVLHDSNNFLTEYQLFGTAQTSLTLSQGSPVGNIFHGIGDAVKP